MNNVIEYSKAIVASLVIGLVAYLIIEMVQSGKEIDRLRNENAKGKAESVTKQKEGELNELKKTTEHKRLILERSITDYESHKRLLEQLKRDRPEDE